VGGGHELSHPVLQHKVPVHLGGVSGLEIPICSALDDALIPLQLNNLTKKKNKHGWGPFVRVLSTSAQFITVS
jgi:hypothetical protein